MTSFVFPWTELVTQKGPRPAFVVQSGEQILTGSGVWRPVSKDVWGEYSGPVVFFGTQKGYTLAVSPETRMMCIPMNGFEKWRYQTVLTKLREQAGRWLESGTEAGKLQIGDRLLIVEPGDYPQRSGLVVDQVRMIDHQHYEGMVYNFDVEVDHTFCANRIGIFCTTRGSTSVVLPEQREDKREEANEA